MAKILIIDDDESVPRALQAALQIAGHEVQIATDADEGLVRATEEDFGVIITDLHWQIRDSKRLEPKGLRLIELLHSVKPRLPVILMTAYPAPDTTIDATKFQRAKRRRAFRVDAPGAHPLTNHPARRDGHALFI